MTRLRPAQLLLAALLFAPPAHAQIPSTYERRELTIPVRDGVKLFAVALIPKGAHEALPIMLNRTPYGATNAIGTDALPGDYKELAEDGYIFVVEDIRGRFKSEGDFVMSRAQEDPRSPKGINESTDAYDTIDWLVKHLPNNNGRVGVMGTSYPGWRAGLAGVGAHPALKAISPQAPMTDTWLGDDFFHQGAFRQTMGVDFVSFMEIDPKGFSGFDYPTLDRYDFYSRFPTLDSLAKSTGVDKLPTWVAMSAHPAHDAFWQGRAMQNFLTKPEVPTLFVGGFWDQEDILGPQLGYRTVEKADTNHSNHIVLGPWFHGMWNGPGGDSLGPIRFNMMTADWYRANVLRPWFAYYLHGMGDGKFPEAWAFETNENQWHRFDHWPPKNAAPKSIYLRESGTISFEAPKAASAFDSYTSDPAHPIPYIQRPDDGAGWQTWLERDQRFVDGRPDVLTWKSAPLTEDFTIAGDVVAHLFASTTGTDADWVVKLIDVYPDTVADRPQMRGYELMVNADIMRGRYWKGFDMATPIPANTVTPFTVDMHQQLYRFMKGHRIMVQVQSSWYPLYDRN
ncbi:MAG: CocE/NonD family hydrolase, partial [Gemmatimonadota bacterium]